jgi:hypothetical protein
MLAWVAAPGLAALGALGICAPHPGAAPVRSDAISAGRRWRWRFRPFLARIGGEPDMQTTFTPEQLRDPGIARANEILRPACIAGSAPRPARPIRCLGDELDSPRGRIYLIKDMLENARRMKRRSSISTAACPAWPA